MTKRTHAIRNRSGKVNGKSKLQVFLYLLMRDDLPTGRVENIIQGIESNHSGYQYCNGWLAKYALDLVKRLEK